MPTTSKDSLLKIMDRVPPCLCRMAAVECGRGKTPRRISVTELSKRSGISRRNFILISHLKSWETVKVGVATKFAEACGINLLQKHPFYDFYRRRYRKGLPYYTRKQREVFDKILEEMNK